MRRRPLRRVVPISSHDCQPQPNSHLQRETEREREREKEREKKRERKRVREEEKERKMANKKESEYRRIVCRYGV